MELITFRMNTITGVNYQILATTTISAAILIHHKNIVIYAGFSMKKRIYLRIYNAPTIIA